MAVIVIINIYFIIVVVLCISTIAQYPPNGSYVVREKLDKLKYPIFVGILSMVK